MVRREVMVGVWPRSAGPTSTAALAGLVIGSGLVVAVLPLGLSAVVVATVLVVGLSVVEPIFALSALLVSIPLSTVVTVDIGDFSLTAVEPLVVLLLVTWLTRGLARREVRLVPGSILAAVGLVVVAVLASSLAAERAGLLFKETAKWLELGLVLAFTATSLTRSRSRLAVTAALVATAVVEASYGIFQYATGTGPVEFALGESLRAFGHFEQPNPFAGYLATVLPLALALSLGRTERRFIGPALGAAAIIGAAIILSQSRGAWLGLLAGLSALAAVWSPSSRRWLARTGVAVSLVVLLMATNVVPGGWSDRLVSIANNLEVFDARSAVLTDENFAAVERMAHWQAGWYMLLDHPVFGVGAGNYPVVYEDYALPGWSEALGHAHNYYLNMAAENGLPGALALLLLLGLTYRTIFRALANSKGDRFTRALAAALLASIVILTVHSLFDDLFVHGIPVQVGFFIGLSAVLAQPADASPSVRSPA